jgi:hypothetical protein
LLLFEPLCNVLGIHSNTIVEIQGIV